MRARNLLTSRSRSRMQATREATGVASRAGLLVAAFGAVILVLCWVAPFPPLAGLVIGAALLCGGLLSVTATVKGSLFTFSVGALVLLLSWVSPYAERGAITVGVTVVIISAMWMVATAVRR